LTGTLPTSLGNGLLANLRLDDNLLTGSIPNTVRGNASESLLYNLGLANNLLTGTIPPSFGFLTALQAAILSNNELSGTLPEFLGNWSQILLIDLGTNQFTGTIASSFANFQMLQRISLNTNYFTGDCNIAMRSPVLTVPYMYNNFFYGMLKVYFPTSLEAIDVSNNILSGAISESVFSNSSSLEVVNLNNNVFDGSIPTSLFRSTNLLSMVLASNCFEGTLPDTICGCSSLQQLILDGLHSATSCDSKVIPGLLGAVFSSPHQVHGKLPACLFQLQNLSLLHMGGNSFSGSIPHLSADHSLVELVLSSNTFTEHVPSSVWNSNITTLDLSFNRLQGILPFNMLYKVHNPATLNQNNTSNSSVVIKLNVNQFAGTIPSFMRNLGPGSVDILEGNMFSCDADRSDIPDNDPKSRIYNCGSDSTNYGLIVFGVVAGVVCLILVAVPTPLRAMRELLAVYRSQYAETAVSALLTDIYSAVDRLTGLCLMGMIVFGVLSVYYSSYADVYVWTVSAIYKTGFSPAMVMFWWLCFCFGLIWVYGVRARDTFFYMGNSSERMTGSLQSSEAKTNLSSATVIVVTLLINVIVVTAVNGFYVSALVLSDYTGSEIVIITVFLSVFKIVWNYALVRGSHFIESLSDAAVVGACLFNNLLAPLLAEMFASSDCFLYIVSQAPAVIFNYDVYLCPTTKGFGEIEPCNFPDLIAEGQGTPVELSIIPPFHYSYQCSFSLISSYVYVFIFRYVITGLLEPLVRWCIYDITVCLSTSQHSALANQVSRLLNVICLILSPFWQTLLYLDITIDQPEKFQQHLLFLQDYVQNGIFRRRWIVLLVTDIAILICFGALFPPLAVVIAVSVIKDVMNVRLSLGKYCSIMERVQDESLKKQMMELKACLDREILQAGEVIWNGIWYGLVRSTWVWAFVLFDTFASSAGVKKGIWILVSMVGYPFVLQGFLLLKTRLMPSSTKSVTLMEEAIDLVVIENPMFNKLSQPQNETNIAFDSVN
jgi:hypothetical protein